MHHGEYGWSRYTGNMGWKVLLQLVYSTSFLSRIASTPHKQMDSSAFRTFSALVTKPSDRCRKNLSYFRDVWILLCTYGSLDAYTGHPSCQFYWRFISPHDPRFASGCQCALDQKPGPQHRFHSKLLALPSYYCALGRPRAPTNHYYQSILPKNCTYALASSLFLFHPSGQILGWPISSVSVPSLLTVELLCCLEIHQQENSPKGWSQRL